MGELIVMGSICNVDVYFLSDTTSSMGDVIEAVQARASDLLEKLGVEAAHVQFGVGNYRDFPEEPDRVFQHQQSVTDNVGDVEAAIKTWTAEGGGDIPEGEL